MAKEESEKLSVIKIEHSFLTWAANVALFPSHSQILYHSHWENKWAPAPAYGPDICHDLQENIKL